jgi:hypothetical protein
MRFKINTFLKHSLQKDYKKKKKKARGLQNSDFWLGRLSVIKIKYALLYASYQSINMAINGCSGTTEKSHDTADRAIAMISTY